MEGFLDDLGDEIEDADEETFYLFSQSPSSRDLGMVDAKAAELDITINNRDFTIKQSPGVLQSKREGGTTGAAVWECSLRLAEWIASDQNALFSRGLLNGHSNVLELGAGISGLVPLALGPRVKRMVASDQHYALRLLQENVDSNSKAGRKKQKGAALPASIEVLALDWETDDFTSTFRSHGLNDAFNVIVACDCVFNYALINPFVDACVESCRYGRTEQDGGQGLIRPALCIVAQQLRQPDVFQQWLETFMKVFRLWRMPDEMLTEKLRDGSGFVVHVGILR